jgi:hypothetical protein
MLELDEVKEGYVELFEAMEYGGGEARALISSWFFQSI